jgi:integrase
MQQQQQVFPKAETLRAGACLSDLAEALRLDHGMWRQRRLELLQGLKGFSRLFGQPLDTIPADPRVWGRWAAEVRTAGNPATIRTLRNVRVVVERFGFSSLAGGHRNRLSPSWADLLASVSHPRHRIYLGPLAQYASGLGVNPKDIDAETVASFRSTLEAEGLRPHPYTMVRSAVLSWNWAKEEVPGWPQLSLAPPSSSDNFSYNWSIFPPSFVADVMAYEHELATGKSQRLGDRGPISERSLAQVDWLLRAYVSALVHSSSSAESITSLADIVQPAAFRTGLTYLIQRSDSKVSRRTSNVAMKVMSVARDWVQLAPDRLEELESLAQRVRLGRDGLSAATREVLRQFDAPENVRALLTLPEKLKRKASRARSVRHSHRFARMALAIELFCFAPIRPTEMPAIKQDNFVRLPDGSLRLSIERNGYRRKLVVTYLLPKSTTSLLDWYLRRHHRPRDGEGETLFQGERSGRELNPDTFRKSIMAAIAIETGLHMPPTCFRHFAAKHYLARHPGDFEIVRAIVGHRSVITTANVYGFMNAAAAATAADGYLRRHVAAAGRTSCAPRPPTIVAQLSRRSATPRLDGGR